MVNLIAFPFRLNQSGSVQTLEESSSEYLQQQIAVLILTEPGSRELVPEFGVEDPTFSQLDRAELAAKIAVFGPVVEILDVNTVYPSDGIARVTVEFDVPVEAETFSTAPDTVIDLEEI